MNRHLLNKLKCCRGIADETRETTGHTSAQTLNVTLSFSPLYFSAYHSLYSHKTIMDSKWHYGLAQKQLQTLCPPVPAHCKSFQGFQRLEAEHCSLQMLVQQHNKVKLSVHLYLEKVKNELSIIINSSWKQHKN